jgi:hypothetical protein
MWFYNVHERVSGYKEMRGADSYAGTKTRTVFPFAS